MNTSLQILSDAQNLLNVEVNGAKVQHIEYRKHITGYGTYFLSAIIGKKVLVSTRQDSVGKAVKDIVAKYRLMSSTEANYHTLSRADITHVIAEGIEEQIIERMLGQNERDPKEVSFEYQGSINGVAYHVDFTGNSGSLCVSLYSFDLKRLYENISDRLAEIIIGKFPHIKEEYLKRKIHADSIYAEQEAERDEYYRNFAQGLQEALSW